MNENRNTTATGNILQQWYFFFGYEKKDSRIFGCPRLCYLEKVIIFKVFHDVFNPAMQDITQLINGIHFHIFVMP